MIRWFLIWAILVAVLVAGVFYFFGIGSSRNSEKAEVSLKGETFKVDVADTPAKQARGLGGRESLDRNEGMLFVFGGSRVRSFWMKDVLIPLDIIWISDDVVVGFDANVPAEPGVSTMNLKKYASPESVNYVLEVAAGTVDRLRLKVGDEVSIQF
jgi:uncharacterized membrane protein (UPF0127 family)